MYVASLVAIVSPTAPVAVVKKSKKKKVGMTDDEWKAALNASGDRQDKEREAFYDKIARRSKLGGMRAMQRRINPNR